MILGIDHVGLAVRHATDAGETFARLTGRVVGEVEDLGTEAVRVCFVPAAPLAGEDDVPAAQREARETSDQPVSWGEARLELLEPADDASAVGRFLARRGEGVHHVCFAVDDIAAELVRLGAAGFDVIDPTPRRGHGGLVAFLHPRGTHGMLVELLQRDGAGRPAASPCAEAPATRVPASPRAPGEGPAPADVAEGR